MISSAQNAKIKLIRALLGRAKERREAGAFVIEGARLAADALDAAWDMRFVIYDETLRARGSALLETLQKNGVDVEEVSPQLMKQISGTETPQGILAVLNLHSLPLPPRPNFLLIPDQIRDPGNLGTLLRSAAAAGAAAALIPPDTADPFAPKVLRAGMGAHFRLPIHILSWKEIQSIIALNGLDVLLADMEGESCWAADLTRPLALVVGGEAQGAGAEARALAHTKIKIPMQAGVESLNAGAAGSVLMFEAARQRSL